MDSNAQLIIQGFINLGTKDWAAWDALSDYFLEQGDEVASEWAKWVRTNRRWPYYAHHDRNTWNWFPESGGKGNLYEHNPLFWQAGLTYKFFAIWGRKTKEWEEMRVGSQTILLAYIFLLNSWRQGTEEERAMWAAQPLRII